MVIAATVSVSPAHAQRCKNLTFIASIVHRCRREAVRKRSEMSSFAYVSKLARRISGLSLRRDLEIKIPIIGGGRSRTAVLGEDSNIR